jgi:hypothetical protein
MAKAKREKNGCGPLLGCWRAGAIRHFRLKISNFDAGVEWILHKPAENTA